MSGADSKILHTRDCMRAKRHNVSFAKPRWDGKSRLTPAFFGAFRSRAIGSNQLVCLVLFGKMTAKEAGTTRKRRPMLF